MKAALLDSVLPVSAADPAPLVSRVTGQHRLSHFALDCLDGLSRDQKSLPCKWLYDDIGSQLFEDITMLAEYYPTRVEEALIGDAVKHLASLRGKPRTLVELGSGASRKTRTLLSSIDSITTYVPIDISAEELGRAQTSLRGDFPALAMKPLCADFTQPATLQLDHLSGPILLFFPGSTLGNMAPVEATEFLRALYTRAGEDTRLLLGVDVQKDERTLCAAYDDAAGVTAGFNLNMLARMNSELGCGIDLSAFRHRAIWNAVESRIEMHIEATSRQVITLLGRAFVMEAGETIHTENSYKLSVPSWREVFEAAGWRMEIDWHSRAPSFLLALLRPNCEGG